MKKTTKQLTVNIYTLILCVLFASLFINDIAAKNNIAAHSTIFDTAHITQMLNGLSNLQQQDESTETTEQLSLRLYAGSWDAERLNPYGVAIDNIVDSTLIDCSDFVYPTKSNRITSRFGSRGARYHYGIDIGLRRGDTIVSTFAGKVRIVDYERRGYGNYVVVRHNNGLETIYAHLSRVKIKENDSVQAGQLIGLGGNTGRSTGPHLHFEMRWQGNAFNPSKLIDFQTKQPLLADLGTYLITKEGTYTHRAELAKMREARYCRVRSGDTLSHIARRYGTTISRLCSLNRIKRTSIIQIGQRIRYR